MTTRKNPLPQKKEMARHMRLLSPSLGLGVISSIPPPTPGFKGLTSSAAGEYDSANIVGEVEIDDEGLRDNGPAIALFPSAAMITTSSSSPSLPLTPAALSPLTTTPTPEWHW